jgi:hypothetical protein
VGACVHPTPRARTRARVQGLAGEVHRQEKCEFRSFAITSVFGRLKWPWPTCAHLPPSYRASEPGCEYPSTPPGPQHRAVSAGRAPAMTGCAVLCMRPSAMLAAVRKRRARPAHGPCRAEQAGVCAGVCAGVRACAGLRARGCARVFGLYDVIFNNPPFEVRDYHGKAHGVVVILQRKARQCKTSNDSVPFHRCFRPIALEAAKQLPTGLEFLGC